HVPALRLPSRHRNVRALGVAVDADARGRGLGTCCPRLSPHSHRGEGRQEEFKRRIKTQTVLPSADTAAMLCWALLASGQINMRKIDGWQTLATKPIDQPIDLAA